MMVHFEDPLTEGKVQVTVDDPKYAKVFEPFIASSGFMTSTSATNRNNVIGIQEEKSDSTRDYEKFQASVDERRRIFVDNRNRSIHANKQSTMFDSWSSSDLHPLLAIDATMEIQSSEKVWKDTASGYLSSKASYDAEKATNTYKSQRGKSPLLMSELFQQHKHLNSRGSESLLFLKRSFSASVAKIPPELTAFDTYLFNSDILSQGVGINLSSNTRSNASPLNRGGQKNSFASIFSGFEDIKLLSQPKPRPSIFLEDSPLPPLVFRSKLTIPDLLEDSFSLIPRKIEESPKKNRKERSASRGSTAKRSFQELQLLKGSFSNNGKQSATSPTLMESAVAAAAAAAADTAESFGKNSSPVQRIPLSSGPLNEKTDRSLYFGEKAKIAFISKFRELVSGQASSTVVKISKAPDERQKVNTSMAENILRNHGSSEKFSGLLPDLFLCSTTSTSASSSGRSSKSVSLGSSLRHSLKHSLEREKEKEREKEREKGRERERKSVKLDPGIRKGTEEGKGDVDKQKPTGSPKDSYSKNYELKESMVEDQRVSEDDSRGDMSPRTRFLTLSMAISLNPPIPIIIRMDFNSQEINLADMGLKDDYIILLSQVLNDLPNVKALNVRNNYLTDRSMTRLIQTISAQTSITSLDLSENKVDDLTAKALYALVERATCPLKVLKLSRADVDDSEVAAFMEAFEFNRSITDLDLSANNLGIKGEDRFAMKKWLSQSALLGTSTDLTGGPAIAAALCCNMSIKILNLSWNSLRQTTAAHLGRAISISRSLTDLNLSYNGIGDLGAEAIASALILNESIVTLDLCSNSIGSIGSHLLAVALRLNKTVGILNLGGNPVGIAGGTSLMETLNYYTCDRWVMLHGCTYPSDNQESTSSKDKESEKKDQSRGAKKDGKASSNNENTNDEDRGKKERGKNKDKEESKTPVGYSLSQNDLLHLSGSFTLDLTAFCDRAVAIELIRTATLKRGCEFRQLTYSLISRGGSSKTNITLCRPKNPAADMGEVYGPFRGGGTRQRHPYTLLQADEWMQIVDRMALLNSATGKPWSVPSEGTLIVEFYRAVRCATPIEALNATGLRRLIDMIVGHRDCLTEILKLCHTLVLESKQLGELITALGSLDEEGVIPFSKHEILEVFLELIVCVRDTSNVSALMHVYFQPNLFQKEMQQTMRSMYYICLGSLSGHYRLDLLNFYDGCAALRLAEINAEERAQTARCLPKWGRKALEVRGQKQAVANGQGQGQGQLVRAGQSQEDYWDDERGFTSQKGFPSNFRNEQYRSAPLPGGMGLTDEFFSKGLKGLSAGVLEFDYISTSAPCSEVAPITDSDLNGLLLVRNIRTAKEGLSRKVELDISRSKEKKFSMKTVQQKLNSISGDMNEGNPILENGEATILLQKKASPIRERSTFGTLFPPSSKGEEDGSAMPGVWLTVSMHSTFEKVKYTLSDLGVEIYRMKDSDIKFMLDEILSGAALYYVCEACIHRFVIRMAIRVLAPFGDQPLVSLDKKKKHPNVGKMGKTDALLSGDFSSVETEEEKGDEKHGDKCLEIKIKKSPSQNIEINADPISTITIKDSHGNEHIGEKDSHGNNHMDDSHGNEHIGDKDSHGNSHMDDSHGNEHIGDKDSHGNEHIGDKDSHTSSNVVSERDCTYGINYDTDSETNSSISSSSDSDDEKSKSLGSSSVPLSRTSGATTPTGLMTPKRGSRRNSSAVKIKGLLPVPGATAVGERERNRDKERRESSSDLGQILEKGNRKNTIKSRKSSRLHAYESISGGVIDSQTAAALFASSLLEKLTKEKNDVKNEKKKRKVLKKFTSGNILDFCCVFTKEALPDLNAEKMAASAASKGKIPVGTAANRPNTSTDEKYDEKADRKEPRYLLKHTGSHPTVDFKPKIPLDNLMMTKVVDNSFQRGMKISPTHSFFKVSDKIIASGSFLVIRVNSNLWMSMRENEETYRLHKLKLKNDRRMDKKERKSGKILGTADQDSQTKTEKSSLTRSLFTDVYARHTVAQFFSGYNIKRSDVTLIDSYLEDIPQGIKERVESNALPIDFPADLIAPKLFICHTVCHHIDVSIRVTNIPYDAGTVLKTSLSTHKIENNLILSQKDTGNDTCGSVRQSSAFFSTIPSSKNKIAEGSKNNKKYVEFQISSDVNLKKVASEKNLKIESEVGEGDKSIPTQTDTNNAIKKREMGNIHEGRDRDRLYFILCWREFEPSRDRGRQDCDKDRKYGNGDGDGDQNDDDKEVRNFMSKSSKELPSLGTQISASLINTNSLKQNIYKGEKYEKQKKPDINEKYDKREKKDVQSSGRTSAGSPNPPFLNEPDSSPPISMMTQPLSPTGSSSSTVSGSAIGTGTGAEIVTALRFGAVTNHTLRLSQLKSLSGFLWLSSSQATMLVKSFPAPQYTTGGTSASSSPENNLRQSAIVILFNRLTDRHNFHLLVDALPLHAHSALYSKIGFLNCIDIVNIDVRFELFELDLSICDNWKMAFILIKLAYNGGGLKLAGEQYKGPGCIPVPGWVVPVDWISDARNIPKEGTFFAETSYTPDDEKPHGWKKFRDALSSKFSLLSVPHGDGRDHHLPPSPLNSHSIPHCTSPAATATTSVCTPVSSMLHGDDRDWDGYPL